MKILFLLFFVSFAFGQFGAIPLSQTTTIYIHDVFLSIILVFWLFGLLRKKHNFVWPALTKSILCFASIGLISLLVNSTRFSQIELLTSSLYLIRWIAYVALYFIITISELRPGFFVRGLYGAGLAIAILGHLQFFFYPDLRNLYYLGWDPHYQRLFSTLLDPNFSGLLFVLLFFHTSFVFSQKPNTLRFVCYAIIVSALLLTFSRSSYLAFGIALISLGVLLKKWKGVILILVFFIWTIVLLPKIGEGQNLIRKTSSFARIENWKEGWQLFVRYPILGNGFNTLRYDRMTTDQYVLNGEIVTSRALSGLDNSMLFILATTGVMGFAAYAWIAKKMIILGGKLKKENHAITSIYFSMLIAIFVHSLFTNSLFYPWVMIWLWIITGVVERKIRARK